MTEPEKKTKKAKPSQNVVDKTVKELHSKLAKAEDHRSKHQKAIADLDKVIGSLRQALRHLDPNSCDDDMEDEGTIQSWEEVLYAYLQTNAGKGFTPKNLFMRITAQEDDYFNDCPTALAVQKWLATQAVDESSAIEKVRRGLYRYYEEEDV